MAPLSPIPMERLLPHRRPMILLDTLVEVEADGCVCETVIRADFPFLEAQGAPACVGVELMAQATAALGGYRAMQSGEPVQPGFLLGVPRFKTLCDGFELGRVLRIEAKEDWGQPPMLRFSCAVRDGADGALLQQAALSVFRPDDLGAYLSESRPDGADGSEAGGP